MDTAEVVVIGAGLVGLALARELDRHHHSVVVLEAGQPGREASWAGAGMLAGWQTAHPRLRPLAVAAARLYPTWIRQLQLETGMDAGFRPGGTLFLAGAGHSAPDPPLEGWERLTPARVRESEPALATSSCEVWRIASDHSVDNRRLGSVLTHALKVRGVAIYTSHRVESVESANGGFLTRCSNGASFSSPLVVNAAGAWAGAWPAPVRLPVEPRKGQMIALAADVVLAHVIAAPGIYLVPRGNGRILAGATLEDADFDRKLDPHWELEFLRRAQALVPGLRNAAVVETWAGFRPWTPDQLPILGPTACPGYLAATGHFRDGILLAPITAKIIAHAIRRGRVTRALDLTPFSPLRFSAQGK